MERNEIKALKRIFEKMEKKLFPTIDSLSMVKIVCVCVCYACLFCMCLFVYKCVDSFVYFSSFRSAAGDCGSSVVVTVSVGDCTSSTYGSSTLASPLLAVKRSTRSFRRNSRNFHTASMTYVMIAPIPVTFGTNQRNRREN